MPQINFNRLYTSLQSAIVTFAEQNQPDNVAIAKQDGLNFLATIEANLNVWAQQLADGEVSTDDFNYLMQSQKDNFDSTALKNAGVSDTQIDNFENGVIQLIVNTTGKDIS